MSEQLRETIARALAEHEAIGGGWYCVCTPTDPETQSHELIEQESWEDHLADAVLALPEVAGLRAKVEAAAEVIAGVRAWCEEGLPVSICASDGCQRLGNIKSERWGAYLCAMHALDGPAAEGEG